MNSCCFPNHVLYPPAYRQWVQWEVPYGYNWVTGTYGPQGHGKSKYPQFPTETLVKLQAKLRSRRIDRGLDEAMARAGVVSIPPHCIVNFLSATRLLHVLRSLVDIKRPGEYGEPHTWGGTRIEDLTLAQLRKLVVLVYARDFGVGRE